MQPSRQRRSQTVNWSSHRPREKRRLPSLCVQLENVSPLAVDFAARLASQSFRRHADQQGLPLFVRRGQTAAAPPERETEEAGEGAGKAEAVGKANLDGSSVFDCVPCEGTLQPGKGPPSTFF